MTAHETVGIVGMGRIGAAVARKLLAAGHPVIAYDVRGEAFDATPAVRRAAGPRDAGAAPIVLIAVLDDAQLRAVLDEVLAAAPRAVVILSTVSAETVRWAGERGRACGVAMIDCGVTGSSRSLAHGHMVAMVGGDDAAIASVEPVLAVFARPVVRMGALGAGMRAKLARNLIHYGAWYMAWEGARLAAAAGVPVDRLVEVVAASEPLTHGSIGLLERGVGPGPADAGDDAELRARAVTAGYAHKDLAAALELAAELGVELPAARLVESGFDAVVGLDA